MNLDRAIDRVHSRLGGSSDRELAATLLSGIAIAGALVGFIFARTRTAARRAAQIWLLVGTAVALLALLVVPVLLYR